jgi:HEPN domain-containing protein
MSPEKKELVLERYEKAEQGILAADIVAEANPMLYDVAAFHAQQCAEKYLKAFLVFNELFPPEVHDLNQWIDLAKGFDSSFEELREVESLSKYSVRTRYPADFAVDTQQQINDILTLAKRVKDFVRQKIAIQ